MGDSIAEEVREILAGEAGVVATYVFGSVGRGTAGPQSDVDVAILLDRPPEPDTLVRIRRALERGLQREIDLVDLHRAPADLVHRVLRDGILVVEGDRSARIAFEVRRRNEYFDLLPVLRRYRQSEAS